MLNDRLENTNGPWIWLTGLRIELSSLLLSSPLRTFRNLSISEMNFDTQVQDKCETARQCEMRLECQRVSIRSLLCFACLHNSKVEQQENQPSPRQTHLLLALPVAFVFKLITKFINHQFIALNIALWWADFRVLLGCQGKPNIRQCMRWISIPSF